jgi:hypothetical protein
MCDIDVKHLNLGGFFYDESLDRNFSLSNLAFYYLKHGLNGKMM